MFGAAAIRLFGLLTPVHFMCTLFQARYVDQELSELHARAAALEPKLNSRTYAFFRWLNPATYQMIGPYEEHPIVGFVFPLWEKLNAIDYERRRVEQLTASVASMDNVLRGIMEGVLIFAMLLVCEKFFWRFFSPSVEEMESLILKDNQEDADTTEVVGLLAKILAPMFAALAAIVSSGIALEVLYIRPAMFGMRHILSALQPKLESRPYAVLHWLRPREFPKVELRIPSGEKCRFEALQKLVERASGLVEKTSETVRETAHFSLRSVGLLFAVQLLCAVSAPDPQAAWETLLSWLPQLQSLLRPLSVIVPKKELTTRGYSGCLPASSA